MRYNQIIDHREGEDMIAQTQHDETFTTHPFWRNQIEPLIKTIGGGHTKDIITLFQVNNEQLLEWRGELSDILGSGGADIKDTKKKLTLLYHKKLLIQKLLTLLSKGVISREGVTGTIFIPSSQEGYEKLSPEEKNSVHYVLTQMITIQFLKGNKLNYHSTHGKISDFIIATYPRCGLNQEMFRGIGAYQIRLRYLLGNKLLQDHVPSTKEEYNMLNSKEQERVRYLLTQEINYKFLRYNEFYITIYGKISNFIIATYPRCGLNQEMFRGIGAYQIRLRYLLGNKLLQDHVPSTKEEYNMLNSKEQERVRYLLTQEINGNFLLGNEFDQKIYGKISDFIIATYPRCGLNQKMFRGRGKKLSKETLDERKNKQQEKLRFLLRSGDYSIPSTKEGYDELDDEQKKRVHGVLTQEINYKFLMNNKFNKNVYGKISDFIIATYPRCGLNQKMFRGIGAYQIRLRYLLGNKLLQDHVPSTKEEYNMLNSKEQERVRYLLTQEINGNFLLGNEFDQKIYGKISDFIIDTYPRCGLNQKMFRGRGKKLSKETLNERKNKQQEKLRFLLRSGDYSIPSTKEGYDILDNDQKKRIHDILTQKITVQFLEGNKLNYHSTHGKISNFIIATYPRCGLNQEMFRGIGIITIISTLLGKRNHEITEEDLIYYVRTTITDRLSFDLTLSEGAPGRIEQRKKLLPPTCDSKGLQGMLGGDIYSTTKLGKKYKRYFDIIIKALPEYKLKPIEYSKLKDRIRGGFYQQACGTGKPGTDYQTLYQLGISDKYNQKFKTLFNSMLKQYVKELSLDISSSNTQGFEQKLLEVIFMLGESAVYYDFGVLIKGALAWVTKTKAFNRLMLYKLNLKTILALGLSQDRFGDDRTGEEHMDRKAYHAGSIAHPEYTETSDDDILSWLDVLRAMDDQDPVRIGFMSVLEEVSTLPITNASKKSQRSTKTPGSTTLSVNKDQFITKLEIACKLSLSEIKIYIEQAKQKQEEEGITGEEDTEESR